MEYLWTQNNLHMYLGEAFAGNWLINKCYNMCWSQQFTWMSYGYAIKFMFPYDSSNAALLDENDLLGAVWHLDADYILQLGEDICFNPLPWNYINHAIAICHDHSVSK